MLYLSAEGKNVSLARHFYLDIIFSNLTLCFIRFIQQKHILDMHYNILSLQAYCSPPKLPYRRYRVKLRVSFLRPRTYRTSYCTTIRVQFQECKQESSVGERHDTELGLLSIHRMENNPSFLNLSQGHGKVTESSVSWVK